jgi:hypothetical protein
MEMKIKNLKSMNSKMLLVVVFSMLLAGCADSVTLQQAIEVEPVGFLYGFWHGAIMPFAFICSLFDSDIAIYAIYNNGCCYDFGFFLGVVGLSVAIFYES